jgi:isochorismate synthase
LHPTPAICGFPLSKSLEFINEFESFNREYYAGFLGPISKSGDFSLWVNLRCAKIQSSTINFYAGAGIVEGSDPEAEYLETERKMDTLRQLV